MTLYLYRCHKREENSMPVNVNGVSGQKGSVASSNGPTMLIEDGKVVIKFNNKKYSLTKQEAEQYCEVLYNINYARNKVDDLKNKLASKKISEEDKQKYSAELSKWNEKYVKQQEAANFEISPNGDVVAFTMKKDIPAETFKELFSIEDGAFRGYLKKEALKDGIGVEKDATGERLNAPFASYDEAMMNGVTSFSNGVYLEPVGDRGNYQPVYSKSILYKGDEIPISSDKVDPHKDTPWYKKWFGMED